LIILRKRVAALSPAALARFVTRASRAASLQGAINVLVTSSQELRGLNSRFLGKDRPTDVLSFPPLLGLDDGFAGDVAISADIATKNARRLGHSTAEEIKILLLHGILHLAGHDHEQDQGEMARTEERLRRSLGLPVALIERDGQPAAKGLNSRARAGPLEMQRLRRQGKSAGGGARATRAR
jgi:probable rRNA maturation factor